MATELWRWQGGTSSDERLHAIDIADDGSVILGGETNGTWVGTNAGQNDFVAVKLSANGTEEWRWQEGTEEDDRFYHITIGENGSAFLFGNSEGSWGETSAGSLDFAVAKISSDGDILWRWQAGTSFGDYLASGAVRPDGSIFVVGFTYGDWDGEGIGSADFAGAMLDADGNELWRWMNGTSSDDIGSDVIIAEDGSIVVCGRTFGNFGGANAGDSDMVVTKLSSDGNSLWTWQNGTEAEDNLRECKMGNDGCIYLAGYTLGDWAGSNSGEDDFAAAKLDADGNEIWRWQDGTPEDERIFAIAITADGALFLAGYTMGSWGSEAAGNGDFAIIKLDPTSGTVLWRWQGGNSETNWITEAASSGDKVVFGANVEGDWEEVSAGLVDFAAMMLESTGLDNNSYPTFSPTQSPLEFSTPVPAPSQASTLNPSSLPVQTPLPTLLSTPLPKPLSTPLPTPPSPEGTETPAPSAPGNSGPSSGSPSSPSPSSSSLSNSSIALISGVSGAVIGVIIASLVVFLVGKRRARHSAPESRSQPRRRGTPSAPSEAPRDPPPDYRTALSQSHA